MESMTFPLNNKSCSTTSTWLAHPSLSKIHVKVHCWFLVMWLHKQSAWTIHQRCLVVLLFVSTQLGMSFRNNQQSMKHNDALLGCLNLYDYKVDYKAPLSKVPKSFNASTKFKQPTNFVTLCLIIPHFISKLQI